MKTKEQVIKIIEAILKIEPKDWIYTSIDTNKPPLKTKYLGLDIELILKGGHSGIEKFVEVLIDDEPLGVSNILLMQLYNKIIELHNLKLKEEREIRINKIYDIITNDKLDKKE